MGNWATLKRTSVRDGRLFGQTFTPVREDTRRDSVRLRDGVIDLAPNRIGVGVRPRLHPRTAQTVVRGNQGNLLLRVTQRSRQLRSALHR